MAELEAEATSIDACIKSGSLVCKEPFGLYLTDFFPPLVFLLKLIGSLEFVLIRRIAGISLESCSL